MKQTIRLTESKLRNIIFNEVKKVLNEGFENYDEQNHDYSVNELQWLYDNQSDLTPFQQKVLNAAMWLRARQANYNGYAKNWSNIKAENGQIFYWQNGDLKKIY